MATFINVDDEYVNAAAVLSYQARNSEVKLRLTDGTERFIRIPTLTVDMLDAAFRELMIAVYAPEQDRTRIITVIGTDIDVRCLE
ncbi:hypothetical protein ACTD5D_10350 [Nocardia takedensis]|uniref:hypothetical protein n=1 Tax=Nocardia takedensis TaxID=259390 RepID=UPI003F76D18D